MQNAQSTQLVTHGFEKQEQLFKCLTKALLIITPNAKFLSQLSPFKDISKFLKVKTQSKELRRQGKSPFLRNTHDTCHFYVDL
jgi:hydroxymethylpyrimidine/phosphomethylpyrimidine kinase